MHDLTELLYEATEGGPNRTLNSAELVREGHRRVNRRRGLVAVSSVVAAVLVIVGAATWLPGVTDDSEPPPGPPVAGGDSGLKQVELSRAEVERRCTIVWRNLYGPDIRPVELANDDTGPWFEGDEVKIANWLDVADWDVDYGGFTEPLHGIDCAIPQAGLEDTTATLQVPLPAANDEAGVRAACGRWLGWDFSNWQVLTADSSDTRLAAVLRSSDGHVSNCKLDARYVAPSGHLDLDAISADPFSYFISAADITDESVHPIDNLGTDDYEIQPYFCKREPPGQWKADCLGTGYVYGPKPAVRIVMTDVTGDEHEIPVVDRWFAFAGTVVNHADTASSYGELRFMVYAADGSVLAEYDESDMPLST
jgi:hypothetical protein